MNQAHEPRTTAPFTQASLGANDDSTNTSPAAAPDDSAVTPTPAEDRRRRLILLSICVVIAVAFLGLSVPFLLRGDDDPDLGGGVGNVISPPRPVKDFTLQQAGGGTPLSISDLRGKPTLLFFGYTHCPDVCPTTLGEFRSVRTQMGADAERVNFLFISVDGSRDTPQSLRDYLNVFDPAFIGMTGPEDVVMAAGQQFGVYFAVNTTTGSAAGYLVDHTTSSYLLDAEGNHVVTYPFGVDPTLVADDVREVIDTEQALGR